MKIYIVTSGYDTTYSIEKIFSNKDNAETYAKWHSYTYVSEYDTDDEEFQTELKNSIKMVTVRYQYDSLKDGKWYEKSCESINVDNVLFKDAETVDALENTFYRRNSVYSNLHNVFLRRKEDETDKEKLKEKYLKICRTIVGGALDLKMLEYSEEQINEWMNKHQEEIDGRI